MARITNPKDKLAKKALAYIKSKIDSVNSAFEEELDPNDKLKIVYKNARDGIAKDHIDDAIAMLRWLYETELGLTPPPALTDAQVDAVDLDIRTFEDGL